MYGKILRLFYSLIKSNKILRKGAFAFSVSKLLTEWNINRNKICKLVQGAYKF